MTHRQGLPRLLLVLVALLVPAGALQAAYARPPLVTTDAASYEPYLLTVGLGAGVEARFGHTILRLVNPKTGRDHNYNWGMFSFDDPYLPLNFFLGRLRYWVSDEPYAPMLRRYLAYERRPVVADRLNLTPTQRERLISRIDQNMQPANIYFWYQYFYQNCATIPRDYIDEAVGGKISERYKNEFTDTTFRDYVRANLNRPPVVGFFLDIVMNARLDKPLSKWVEMFYPPKLREYLLALPAWDDQGEPLAGRSLLSDGERLNALPDVASSPTFIQPWFLGIGLSLLALLAALLLRRQGLAQGFTARLGFKLMGTAFMLWGLFSGLLGTIMAVSWAWSEHLDLHHNANLWLFWPLDFLYIALGLALWRADAAPRLLGRLGRVSYSLGMAHLVFFAAFVSLRLVAVIEQNVDQVLLYIGPVATGLYMLLACATKLALLGIPPSPEQRLRRRL